MASVSVGEGQADQRRASDHESFLAHKGKRWLKVALALSLAAIVGYLFADVEPRPNGGTWYGYALGTLGAGLIVWLALLGVRKRAMTRGRWSLKAWTSAHVYLGLALIVIATLHTGFQFGWNVHTLAYALMMLVIASGVYGIAAYATLPQELSSNRREMTQGQMVESLAAIDRQLEAAAQPPVRSRHDANMALLDREIGEVDIVLRGAADGQLGLRQLALADDLAPGRGQVDAADPEHHRARYQ